MDKGKTIIVLNEEIRITDKNYISLTDMLRSKDGNFFITDWLRNRNTLEYIGIWERVHNPDFNYGEFAIIKSQAGLNSYKISVKEWVSKTNYANVSQLVCLANLETLNAHLIQQELPQAERLKFLNITAIQQMRLLTEDKNIKKLEGAH